MSAETLVVIPVRAGSQGIPRKGLQTVAGKPLVVHAIELAQRWQARHADPGDVRIAVSTDWPEVAGVAAMHGVEILQRPAHLATGEVPLADVAKHITETDHGFARLLMLEPTAFGVAVGDLDALARHQDDPTMDRPCCTVLVAQSHRQTWHDGRRITALVNRQYRDPDDLVGTEVGVRLMPRACAGRRGDCNRWARAVAAHGDIVDIDTWEDLALADMRAARGHVWIRCIGAPKTGTGHVQRCLVLADLLRRRHHVSVDVIDGAGWAADRFAARGLYPPKPDAHPSVIVSDALGDWRPPERYAAAPLVVLEPATTVTSAMWPGGVRVIDEMRDPSYAVVREEVAALPPVGCRPQRDEVRRVLVTCGGADHDGLGARIASAPALAGMEVRLLVGPAGKVPHGLGAHVRVVHGADVADELWRTDLVLCSGGRTRYEAAAAGTPAIVVCANEREATHTPIEGPRLPAALSARGAWQLDDAAVHEWVGRALAWLRTPAERRRIAEANADLSDRRGAERVVHMIEAAILDGMRGGSRP